MKRALLLSVLTLVACHHDPVRDAVEKDTDCNGLAVAACADAKRKMPADACHRVAIHCADKLRATAAPRGMPDCEDAFTMAERFAPERLAEIAPKCCFIPDGLDSASSEICKRLKVTPPPNPWASDREWAFIHNAIKDRLDHDVEIPGDGAKMARDICTRRQREGRPIPECPEVLARLPK
jgi:hypothetical protein